MRARAGLILLVALLVAGCAGPDGPAPTRPAGDAPASGGAGPPDGDGSARLRLEPVIDGLRQPLLLTHAGDGSARLFVAEQGGVVRVARNGTLLDAPFLDVSERTVAEGERGFLGLAFPPDHAESRRVYVSHTDREGDSVLARYRVAADDPDRVDPSTEEVLLRVDQPYPNHNGGHLAFGPDGMLYYGLGDGGAAGDPHGNGQDPHALLGSLLRLDVSGASGYAIPPDNPFADGQAGAREVWAKGLRNPWRFSFDRGTGDLFLGDVGQGDWEEVDHQPAGAPGGANYGWSVYEGAHRFKPFAEPFSPVTNPVAEYAREDGACAVTGGYVYRGEAVPALRGVHVFADYCKGTLFGLVQREGAWRTAPLLQTDARVSSFGEDEAGELYVVDHGGRVLRVAGADAALPAALR